jgi:hypothetical protein
MSYATNILRRRQEMERAFRERYNPMEDVVSALSDIDKEAFRREQLMSEEERAKAEEQRRVERFGLEKIKTEKETARLAREELEARDDRAALAEERRARGAEWAAREAAVRQKTKQEEEDAARKAVVEKGYGMMRGAGLPGPGATPVSKSDLEELGAAVGMTADEVLSGIEQLESERSKLGAGLGLTGAQIEATKALERLRNRQGLPKPPKVLTPEEQQAAKERATYDRLRNERLKRALSEKGGFVPTEEEVNKMQTARRQVIAAQASTNVLRQLMNKYPDFKSYVGPVDGLINRFKAKFGANSREAAEVQSAINRVFQAYKVATTGAAAGVLEMEDLKNIMPKETDNFDAILGKLDAAERMAQTSVDALDLVLDKMDIRAADPLARGLPVAAPLLDMPTSGAKPAAALRDMRGSGASPPAASIAPPMSDDELDQYEVQ